MTERKLGASRLGFPLFFTHARDTGVRHGDMPLPSSRKESSSEHATVSELTLPPRAGEATGSGGDCAVPEGAWEQPRLGSGQWLPSETQTHGRRSVEPCRGAGIIENPSS